MLDPLCPECHRDLPQPLCVQDRLPRTVLTARRPTAILGRDDVVGPSDSRPDQMTLCQTVPNSRRPSWRWPAHLLMPSCLVWSGQRPSHDSRQPSGAGRVLAWGRCRFLWGDGRTHRTTHAQQEPSQPTMPTPGRRQRPNGCRLVWGGASCRCFCTVNQEPFPTACLPSAGRWQAAGAGG